MILALDFDGVMHPVRTTTEPKFCRMHILEGWLRQRPDVGVVISSSWRAVHPFDEMRSFFAEDLQARVLGATPQVISAAAFKRQLEIEQWIAASDTPGAAWVALDDNPEFFEPGCRNLVTCNPDVGLTTDQLHQLDACFGFGQICSANALRMLTTQQAAAALNVSRAYVLQLVATNAFGGVVFTKGHHRRIPQTEVERVRKSMQSSMRKAIDEIARITEDASHRELQEAKQKATRHWASIRTGNDE